MPYAGYCQACFNENPKAEGRACGQDPLSYCDKHLVETRADIIKWQADAFPPGYGEYWKKFLIEIEKEILARIL